MVRLPTAGAGRRTMNVLCLIHNNFLSPICFIGNLNSKSQFNTQDVEVFFFDFALLHKCKCPRDNANHHSVAEAKDRSFCYLFCSGAKLKNKR